MPKHKLLAIDPGLRDLGIALFEGDDLTDCSVKSLRRPGNNYIRLFALAQEVDSLLDELNPSMIVLAGLSPFKVSRSSDVLAAAGKIRLVAMSRSIGVRELEPATIKKAVTGNHKSTNRDVQNVLCTHFPRLEKFRESNGTSKKRYYQNLFDAVACGFAFLRLNEQNSHERE